MAFKFSEALCCGDIVAGKIRSDKGNNDEEDDDIEFCNKRDGSTSNKEAKNNDQKANALRSKHSVTEQRRRSKINERFQILRSLIPLSDQKRDTASFLLEVIEYVQFLQERVQRYEGLYHGWNTEQNKSITSRNNQWRMPSFGEQHMRSCSVTGAMSGGFGEQQMCIHPAMFTNAQNTLTYDPSSDDLACCKPLDPHPDIVNKDLSVRTPSQTSARDALLEEQLQRPSSDTRSTDFPRAAVDLLNQPEDLIVEAGNISISTAYSQGLFNVLSQSLHNAGVDLNQAQISVQIELGKRVNQAEPSRSTALGECGMTHFGEEEASSEEDTDECTKRMKL